MVLPPLHALQAVSRRSRSVSCYLWLWPWCTPKLLQSWNTLSMYSVSLLIVVELNWPDMPDVQRVVKLLGASLPSIATIGRIWQILLRRKWQKLERRFQFQPVAARINTLAGPYSIPDG